MKHTGPAVLPDGTLANQTNSKPDLQEQIRLRAYGLYEQRRRESRELQDWLQAEAEVNQSAKTLVA
jgi:hypothetical protein